MQLLKQSTASTVYIGPVLDSAGAAVTTAVVGDFRLIKNGTAATLSGATVTHDANGYYTVALTTTNTDTTGRLTLAVGNTAMSMSTHRYSVLLASVYDALITNATNATGGLPTATGSISALAGAISTLTAAGVRSELATELNRIDATISSRSSQTSVDTLAGYVDTEVAAIKAKTDNLPTDPADASDIAASFGTVNSTLATIAGYIDTEVAAIKAKTDNLPTDPAAVSDIPTTSAIANAVAATQALSRLDSMIESDGAGQFRFDTIALSMGAGGGGGTDWTANERTAIRSILGFDSNGTVSLPTVGVMDAIKDKTDLITSDGISVLEDRVNESTITMQYNESTTASVNLDEDTTSATLQFVVSRPDGTDILTIANGSITRTASSFTVTITTAVTATLGQYLWSLRDITGGTNRVVTKGVLTVQNAASA